MRRRIGFVQGFRVHTGEVDDDGIALRRRLLVAGGPVQVQAIARRLPVADAARAPRGEKVIDAHLRDAHTWQVTPSPGDTGGSRCTLSAYKERTPGTIGAAGAGEVPSPVNRGPIAPKCR